MSRSWIAMLSTVALLAGSPAHGDSSRPTSELEWRLIEAQTAAGVGEPRVAESFLREALREAWHGLGSLAAARGDVAAAEDAFSRARNAAAEGPSAEGIAARRDLARVLLLRGEVEEALKELRLLAHENPSDPELLGIFVRGLIHGERDEELAVELEELRALDPRAAQELSRLTAASALPPLTGLAGAWGAVEEPEREALGERLRATILEIHGLLAEIQERTGFEGSAARRRAAIVELFGEVEAEPLGPIDRIELGPEVEPLELDPAKRLTEFPEQLHGWIERLDGGDLEGVEADLRQRLESEDDPDARTLLGLVLAAAGRGEAAEAELLRAVESGPRPLVARQALARVYWHSDRRDAAKQQLLQAAELGELDRDLSLALADIEIADRRLPAANRQLRSLDRRFKSAEAMVRFGAVYTSLDRRKQALDYLREARERAPSSEEVLALFADKALELNLPSDAVRAVEPLARMAPETARYQYFLGRVWVGLYKMGEASEALLRSVELDPDHVPSFLPLGLALNHESRFEEARGYLERYLEAYPESLDARAGLAESEERLGQAESAEERANAVLAEDPDHARAHLVVGMVSSGRGEFAEARASLERAIEADPRLAKAHYQLSFACARLGDRACAREHLATYKRVLEGPEATFVRLGAESEEESQLMKRVPSEPPS